MASKKGNRNSRGSRGMKKTKFQPAPLNLSFTAAGGESTNWIDLSQCASVVNRRFYRQGLNWAVSGITVTVTGTTTSPGSVTISKVPNTWVASNAWHKSFATWNRMNDQVLDEDPSIKPRYHDFKVYLNSAMKGGQQQNSITTPVDGDILVPTDAAYNLPTMGEWKYSTIQIPNDGEPSIPGNTVEYNLHMLGDSTTTSKGLIQGYAHSRARPQPLDPNVTAVTGTTIAENWMTELFDVGDNLPEIRADLDDDNDAPPYKVGEHGSGIEYYPGGETQLPGPEVVGYAVISSPGGTNAITAQRNIRGSNFPCGLIQIDTALAGITAYDIIVHLVPGSHKGYLCEPMQDM